ncbi:hypothetical protein V6Z11_A09G286600 [Gossypium hirsutum]
MSSFVLLPNVSTSEGQRKDTVQFPCYCQPFFIVLNLIRS